MNDELTPQEIEELTGRLAREVVGRGLEVPAILFLEMHKPLAFMAGQGMLVAAPALGAFLGMENMHRFALFISSRDNIERLICRIEDLTEEARRKARP
ncbi:MAG: hypothetical protein IT210_13165 [Armatimonadetes bacterium]|nr:hypothetical protein [Armatimonadota bacterium]